MKSPLERQLGVPPFIMCARGETAIHLRFYMFVKNMLMFRNFFVMILIEVFFLLFHIYMFFLLFFTFKYF
ncbi:rCG51697 [Rattus norvegicus]|uniref:RCG51697 n=1 Tax=Rattus norvegicus TaxID=10116 RepID=A6KUV2_RAT|nr:rCG51697 [Rattus norvegicus]